MMWNIISIWCAIVLVFRLFIYPSFLPDTEDEEELLEQVTDETIWYAKVCLSGIIISSIFAMLV